MKKIFQYTLIDLQHPEKSILWNGKYFCSFVGYDVDGIPVLIPEQEGDCKRLWRQDIFNFYDFPCKINHLSLYTTGNYNPLEMYLIPCLDYHFTLGKIIDPEGGFFK